MSLVVGFDSYVDLEEANKIINDTHLSTSELVLKWNGLNDNDKEVLLRTSCRSIDNLKFDGKRKVIGQRLEFPRVKSFQVGLGYRLYVSQFVDNGLVDGDITEDGGLGLVKEAQVVNALYAALLDEVVTNQVGINIRGITMKKAGSVAESYNIGTGNKYNRDALRGIYTDKVYSLLTPWVSDARGKI